MRASGNRLRHVLEQVVVNQNCRIVFHPVRDMIQHVMVELSSSQKDTAGCITRGYWKIPICRVRSIKYVMVNPHVVGPTANRISPDGPILVRVAGAASGRRGAHGPSVPVGILNLIVRLDANHLSKHSSDVPAVTEYFEIVDNEVLAIKYNGGNDGIVIDAGRWTGVRYRIVHVKLRTRPGTSREPGPVHADVDAACCDNSSRGGIQVAIHGCSRTRETPCSVLISGKRRERAVSEMPRVSATKDDRVTGINRGRGSESCSRGHPRRVLPRCGLRGSAV